MPDLILHCRLGAAKEILDYDNRWCEDLIEVGSLKSMHFPFSALPDNAGSRRSKPRQPTFDTISLDGLDVVATSQDRRLRTRAQL